MAIPVIRRDEKAVIDGKPLSKEAYYRLVGARARQLGNPKRGPVRDEDARRAAEAEISEAFLEKVHLERDFLPARFLEDGARRSRSVCRIVTPEGLGTGSLIAPGVLLTNHHVLPRMEVAERSFAEFDYEDGRTAVTVRALPDQLYLANEALDFAIVACEQSGLGDREPIWLTRDPHKVAVNERVNIVQHPRGRTKEVALHNNETIKIFEKVLHYRTDTEPGSSGSPVFNNRWELVALHHAGWGDTSKPGAAINEGIRISAIVAHLLRESTQENKRSPQVEEILRRAGTSPLFGFFDVAGLPGTKEIEIPDFTGDKRFADVGFWNIEHFNSSVGAQRITDVAGVVGRLGMDVLGLVEVEEGACKRLVQQLATQRLSYGFKLLDGEGRQDLAVLFDRETTDVELLPAIAQRNAARLDARTPAGKTAFPRKPLFARCTVDEGAQKLEFIMVVLHLKAFGDAESRARRALAAEKLSEIIADIRATERLPVLVGGDYNELLTTDVLAPLRDSPDLVALTADDATTDAISFVGASHKSLIDHIVVSKDVKVGAISGDDAAIVRLDKSVSDFAGRISDHVPVVMRLVYRNAPVDVPGGGGLGDLAFDLPAGAKKGKLQFE